MTRLQNEIASFKNLWCGGFVTGYNLKRNQRGIEDYLTERIKPSDTVLEIGCGRGQWSRLIAQISHRLHCVDVLSSSHNRFWTFLPKLLHKRVHYHQVFNFKLEPISDRSVDFVFSYDVFCHISAQGQLAYLKSIFQKCKPGAWVMIMYADPGKYLRSEPENEWHVRRYLPNPNTTKLIYDALKDKNGNVIPGRWYWVGIEHFVAMALSCGFTVRAKDLNIDKTNPISLLQRP